MVFQDLHLIWAVLMSPQRAKQLPAAVYRLIVHIYKPAEGNKAVLELQLILKVKVKMLCENLKTQMWQFDDGWRHEVITKFISEVMNPKFYNTLPSTIRYLKKWKFCMWHCRMFSESNRTVPNSVKLKIFITILLGAYSSLRLVVPQ